MHRSMTLHAGPWVCMQFCKLTVPWAYMKFHELAVSCNFKSLYAVPFFVWAAHKDFAVLRVYINITYLCTYVIQALLSISAVWYVWYFSCLRSGICVICTYVLEITARQWRGRGSGRGRQLGKTFYRRREEWHVVTVTSGSNLKHEV